MRYLWPKRKLCRREGINLFWVEKYNFFKKKRKALRTKKSTEYASQLREKQMLKRMFGLSEKQFSNLYKKAVKKHKEETVGEKFLQMLELRLDNIIYRANLARTRMQARQFISHAHFSLNGKKVNIPSLQVKVGDVIELREKMKEKELYKTLMEELKEFSQKNKGVVTKTKWIEVDPINVRITIKGIPSKDDFEKVVNIQKVIEFYSK